MVLFKVGEIITADEPLSVKGVTLYKMYKVISIDSNPMMENPRNYLVKIIDDNGVISAYHYTHFRKTNRTERLLYGKN